VKHGFVDMTLFQNFPPEIYLQYASLKLMPQFETLPSLGLNSETNANAEDLNANAEGLNANAEDT